MSLINSQVNIITQTQTQTQTQTNQYFDQYLAKDLSLRMMEIPAGSFQMGSPDHELKRFETEIPQHFVKLPPYFLAKYPVTEVQWSVVSQFPEQNRSLNPPSESKGGDYPIVGVSWREAVEFCDRLSSHTGRPYHLPTESEWEYACRAGTATPFHFGETISPELANYHSETSYNNGPTGESLGATTSVGQYQVANGFGLSDMHGNVLEWCQDNWHGTYEGAPNDGSVWGTDDEARHVCRGGSWGSIPRGCRSASRVSINFNHYVGFRVACSAPSM